MTFDIAREIYYKAVFRRGGQPQSAYDETYTFLFKHYGKKLSLFVANQIERDFMARRGVRGSADTAAKKSAAIPFNKAVSVSSMGR